MLPETSDPSAWPNGRPHAPTCRSSAAGSDSNPRARQWLHLLAADILFEVSQVANRVERPDIARMVTAIAEAPFAQLDSARLDAESSPERHELLAAFSRSVGLTPWQLLVQTRVRVARRLLTHTAWQIDDIGTHLGFSSVSSFACHFLHIEGRTPLEYRLGRHQMPTIGLALAGRPGRAATPPGRSSRLTEATP